MGFWKKEQSIYILRTKYIYFKNIFPRLRTFQFKNKIHIFKNKKHIFKKTANFYKKRTFGEQKRPPD